MLVDLISTLLATGRCSPETCQMLLIAHRGSVLEVLAACSSAAPRTQVPLSLCGHAGLPLLSDLREGLLDEQLAQVTLQMSLLHWHLLRVVSGDILKCGVEHSAHSSLNPQVQLDLI